MLSPVPIANVIFLSITDDDPAPRAFVSTSMRTFDLTIAILHHARGLWCSVALSSRWNHVFTCRPRKIPRYHRGAIPWQSSIRKVFVDFHGIVPGAQANVTFHVRGNVIFHSIAKRPARARCSCPLLMHGNSSDRWTSRGNIAFHMEMWKYFH